jgi:ABC-type antimicrobial peptide transport system permease subunit
VINQEAADAYFGDKALSAALVDSNGFRTQIIGVVKSQPLGTFEQHVQPAIYLPMWQEHPSRMTLVIRASKPDAQVIAALRRKIESVPGGDSSSPQITTMDTRLAQSGLAPLRIATIIFASSAVIAFVLSILGSLSVHSDTERQRRRELALRIALGAQRRHIFSQTIKQVGQLAFTGIMTGTLVAIAGLRTFANDLSMISSPPIQVWFLAPILSLLTLIITAAIVASQAMRVELLTVMREDG